MDWLRQDRVEEGRQKARGNKREEGGEVGQGLGERSNMVIL